MQTLRVYYLNNNGQGYNTVDYSMTMTDTLFLQTLNSPLFYRFIQVPNQ